MRLENVKLELAYIALGLATGLPMVGIYLMASRNNESTVRAPSLSNTLLSPELDSQPVSGGARTVLPEPEADPELAHDNTATPTTLPDAGGDTESPPALTSKAVLAFVKEHPNSPLRFIPSDATAMQLAYLEGQAEVILGDWQKVRDALWTAHNDNLLAFVNDPSVTQNDKDRQQRLKSLVQSLWPNAMP